MNRVSLIHRECGYCGKSIYVKPCRLSRGEGKFCSIKCSCASKRRKRLPSTPISIKRQCCLCLAQIGFGYDRISKRLSWKKKSVYRTVKSAVRNKIVTLNFTRSHHPTGIRKRTPPKPKIPRYTRIDPAIKAQRSIAKMNARNRVKRLRKFVWLWVFKNVKSFTAQEITGCSRSHFQNHIQSKFSFGMAWNNYGKLWELDHIIPCSKFDLSKPENIRSCFHFSNYQPLLIRQNRSKSAKVKPTQPELPIPFTDRHNTRGTTAIIQYSRGWIPDRHTAATAQRPAVTVENPQALVCTTSKPS